MFRLFTPTLGTTKSRQTYQIREETAASIRLEPYYAGELLPLLGHVALAAWKWSASCWSVKRLRHSYEWVKLYLGV